MSTGSMRLTKGKIVTIAARTLGFTRPDEDGMGRIVGGLFSLALTIGPARRTNSRVNAHSYLDVRPKHTPDHSKHATVGNFLRASHPDVNRTYFQLRWPLPWPDTRSRCRYQSDPALSGALRLLVTAQGTQHETRGFWVRRWEIRWPVIAVFRSVMLSQLLILASIMHAVRDRP